MNIAQVARAIDKVGKPGVLRRVAVGGRHVPLDVRHITQQYVPAEMVGGIIQGDQKVIISNREIAERAWPGPPRRGDQLYTGRGGKTGTVQGVSTMQVRDEIAMHIMQVRGL